MKMSEQKTKLQTKIETTIRFQVQAPPRPPMNWHPQRPPMLHPSPFIRPGGPGPGQMQMGPSPGPMRPQYTHHPPSGHPYSPQPIRIMSPQGGQGQRSGPMPPLYRVPVSHPQQQQPPQPQGNQRPQHRPLFQMTSTPPRQSIFLKSRLQKAVNVNGDGSGNFAIHPQQAILSNQTAIRPRFLSPPAPGPIQFQSVAIPMGSGGSTVHHLKEESNTPSPKLPKIHSVHSGVIIDDLHLEQQESEESSPMMRTSDDMTSVLVHRGITIKRNKPAPNGVVIKAEPQTEPEDAGDSTNIDDSFLSCPVNTCNERFLTETGLQRHVERVHKKEPVKVIVKGGPSIPTHDKPQTISIKNGLLLKSFKCASCTAHFTTQQGLIQHQHQHHHGKDDGHNSRNTSPQSPMLKASLVKGNPVPNEVGIPLVDLSNEMTRRKLANLGIFNFIPVANRDLACGGFFGFPVVSLQGASNPSICNLGELGASSILSIGPVRQIPKH